MHAMVLWVLLIAGSVGVAEASSTKPVIVCPANSPRNVKLAAKEIRRYVYLRSGKLLSLAESGHGVLLRLDKQLETQQYRFKTEGADLTISGGSDVAVLYGVYAFAEKLGVRFYLDGDMIPDGRVAFALPDLDETHKPLFDRRGLLPFHDFVEGPDWWNLDDYEVYFTQMAKLRMNFIGLHNYPERHGDYPGPEPTVWIGLPEEMDHRGNVTLSYPAFFANTLRPGWGNIPMKTSQYVAGASELFEHDGYGPETQIGHCPWPEEAADCNAVFNQTGVMYRDAFAWARGLGIATCVGTETPLTVPQKVQERLKSQGKEPADPDVIRKLYQGVFQRIARAFPVDYYWLWTPEDWTWGGNKPGQFEATTNDLQAALDALNELGNPMTLATCGWVLGPQNDRAALDKFLPKTSPMSCINQSVGHAPVEAGFEKVHDRPKWAIPWLENDPNMTGPQLWVGRMFYDGADALRYGCTGLLGIHWRTKVIGMNIAALAQAGWSAPQSLPAPNRGSAGEDRSLGAAAFYQDWAASNFGSSVRPEIAALFTGLDGKWFPEISQWGAGPGRVKVNDRPWTQEAKRYAFVDEMEALRSKVKGVGNLARFDYWLNTFRYARAMAQFGCAAGELNRIMKAPDVDQERAVAVRELLAELWADAIHFQMAAVNTPGELGTIANLEQQSRGAANLLGKHDAALQKLLGGPLPARCQPPTSYDGPGRLIVPTVRTVARRGEKIWVKVIALDKAPVSRVTLHVRPMGKGNWRTISVLHVARAVYRVNLPEARDDFEYYITAKTVSGSTLIWPSTAPEMNQTVVLTEPEPSL